MFSHYDRARRNPALRSSCARAAALRAGVYFGAAGLSLAPAVCLRAAADEFQGLGFFPGGTYSVAYGISADGTTVIGTGDSTAVPGGEAFRWTSGAGMVGLGLLNGGTSSQAGGVSTDGSVVVGSAQDGAAGNAFRAFRWTQGTGMVSLGVLNGGTQSDAIGVSADGSVVAGTAGDGAAANFSRAYRWTSGTGMVSLGMLAGGTFSRAYAISPNGSVVVGLSDSTAFPSGEAFRWKAGTGMQSVRDLLVAGGVNMTGWWLYSAQGVSADETVIVGYGNNPSSQTEAWIARFGPSGAGLITVNAAAQSFAGNAALGHTGSAYIGSTLATMTELAVQNLDPNANPNKPYLVFAYGAYDSDPTGSGTLGLTHDLGDNVVLGATMGAAQIRTDMIFDGNAKMDGGSIGAFVTRSRQLGLQWTLGASATTLKGTVDRGYLNGSGLAHSAGSTSAVGYGGTARIGYAFDVLKATRLTPFVSYTGSTIRYGGWTETSGVFPAQFDAFRDTAHVSRLGGDARYTFAPGQWMWGTLAWGHRLNGSQTAKISGQLLGLFALSVPGVPAAADWAEITAGVRSPFGPRGSMTASLTATVPSNHPTTWQARVGVSQAF
jgi:probable HAF family extracellular repeat protein